MGQFEQAVLLAILHPGDNAYGMEIRAPPSRSASAAMWPPGPCIPPLERLSREGTCPAAWASPRPL